MFAGPFTCGLRPGISNGLEVLLEELVERVALLRYEVTIRAIWTLRSVVDLADFAGVAPSHLYHWLRESRHVSMLARRRRVERSCATTPSPVTSHPRVRGRRLSLSLESRGGVRHVE